ncbi:MAG: hypothetical protein V3W19_08890, partial [Desulfatiglandales bacterium]
IFKYQARGYLPQKSSARNMIIKPQTDADKYLADLARYHKSCPSGKISQRLTMLFSTKAGFSFAKRCWIDKKI